MNKIYKVIWSKAKHTYVVASEIAKGHTKGETTGKGLKKLAAAMLVAAALLSPSFAWAADATTKFEPAADQTSTTAVAVYTKDEADNKFATINSLATVSTAVQTQATDINTNSTNIIGLTNRVTALENPKTDTALHISSSYDLIVGTKENQIVRDMGIRGELTSGSVSTGDITSTGDVTVAGKMAADGVTDETTKDGTYIKQNNTVGNNLVSLDKQVKANADAVSELDTRITNVKEYVLSETNNNYVSKTDAAVQDGAIVKAANTIGDNVTKLDAALAKETAARLGADAAQDKVIKQVNDNLVASVNTINESVKTTNENMAAGFTALSQADAAETAAREAADTELNERITNEANAIHDEIKAGDKALDERITNVKEYVLSETVSKADAAVQDGAVVKATNTIGENVANLDAALDAEKNARIWADKTQDKVIQQVNDNLVASVNNINTNMAAGFKALSQADANELAGRVAADAKLAEAVNGGLSLSDNNVLQKNTTKVNSDGTVSTSKNDANEMILNKNNDNRITMNENGIKVGKNSTVMDKDGVYTGGDTYSEAKAAMSADGSIKGAGGDFTVDGTNGNVNTKGSVTAASGTIGNVSMSADGTVTGVKDLTASGKVTADSFTDGTATMSNGSLNGVNQINATGNIVTTGNMKAHDITAEGTIKGETINGTTGTFGSLTTTSNASVGGKLTANGITNTGNVITDTLTVNHNATVGGDLGVTGDITGKSLNVGTGDIKGGQITGTGLDVGAGTIKTTGAVETGTLTTTGDATIGGNLTVDKDLTVNGKFNAKTLSSKLDENNYTTINGGKTESRNLKMDAKTLEIQASASTFDETGSQVLARDDDSKGLSTVTADSVKQSISDVGDNEKNYASRELSQNTDNKYEITDSVVEGNQSNVENRTADTTDSQISLKDDSGKVLNKSYITQNLKKVLMGVEEGGNKTTIEQDANNITNTAKNGTIKNDADKVLNQGTTSVISQIGDGTAVKSELTAGGITNTAVGGTISNSAKDLVNTATGNMTNTVGGTLTTTVTGKVTEDYKSDLDTKVGGNETHYVKGNQTNTVSGDRTVNVKGTEKENFNAQVTNIKTDQRTSVGGNQTNIVAGNQQNTVSGSKTETVKGSVTEKYGSQATTVDGDQRTNVGGNQSNVVAGNQTNTISGSKTESVKGAVTETYGSQTTKVNGDQSTTVAGSQTNSITGDQVNTIGGNQTTTVTGDSSLSAKNISNTASETLSNSAKNINNSATEKLSNSAAEIENKATTSINNSVGDNVSSSMTINKITESVKDGTKSNTFTKTADKDINIVTDGTKSSTESQLADSVNTSLKVVDAEGKTTQSLSNVKTVSDDTTKITDTTKNAFSSSSQKADSITSTVKDMGKGTISERSQTVSQVQDKVGTTTVTTTDGLTKLTNEAGTHNTQMDFAEVLKDLGVRGNAVVDGTSTLKGDVTMESNASVGKNLTVNGDTTMEGSATVNKDLTVDGATNLKGNAIIGTDASNTLTVNSKSTFNNGVTVKGGTTTDTLHVTSTATFDDIVTMKSDLNVGGNAKVAGDVTAKSFKVGENTYIDENGINANNKVIKNVGQGDISANSTDAVSGGQLYETNTRVSGLETRMGTVETKVDKLDNKIDKVGANAAAMANLHPLEFDEDSKWNIAAAVGSSGSETASAVGVFYRPNENVMVNASAAMGTGENMFGGGVSLRIGHGGNKAKEAQMKAAAKENRELRAKVDDLTARMDALLSVLNPNMSKNFPDVPENHWAYEAVSRLAGNGIVEGYEDGKYHGERQMTRYEMAEIIYNALSKGAKAEKKLVEEFRPELQAMAAQKKA